MSDPLAERYALSIQHEFTVSEGDKATQYFDFISQAIDYGIGQGADRKLLSALLIAKAQHEAGDAIPSNNRTNK